MKLPEGAWVVVADGEKHLLLQNKGDQAHLDLRVRSVDEAEPSNWEHTPAGSRQGPDGRRAAVSATDLKGAEEEEYTKALATKIDAAAKAHKIKDLVLIADPRTMGILRGQIGSNAGALVLREIVGDFAHMTIEHIEDVVKRA